jgi:hypothetical protein
VSIIPLRDVKRQNESQSWVSAGSAAENLLASLKPAPRKPEQAAQLELDLPKAA